MEKKTEGAGSREEEKITMEIVTTNVIDHLTATECNADRSCQLWIPLKIMKLMKFYQKSSRKDIRIRERIYTPASIIHLTPAPNP